ncbi:hypothetical protein T484DRAFT_1745600 [Baffinella frigidus]|nr:hypothetical protein T484DRAFT_1745600 [Cryptophyta sp. CCMP2293]
MADGTEHSAESAAWGQQQAAGRRGACHGLDDPVGCERPRRQGRDSAGMGLAAVCLAAMMLGGAEGNFLEERHRADRKCSLATVEVPSPSPSNMAGACENPAGAERETAAERSPGQRRGRALRLNLSIIGGQHQ